MPHLNPWRAMACALCLLAVLPIRTGAASTYRYGGVQTWGGSGVDTAGVMAVDRAGNRYVTGYFSGAVDLDPGPGVMSRTSAGARDVYLCKFDAAGALLWAATWGGTGEDSGYGLALDDDGNAYVTGRFQNTVDFDPGPLADSHASNGLNDGFLCKYGADGAYRWARTWGGSDGEECYGPAVDNAGHVYVVGDFASTSVDFDPGPGEDVHANHGFYDAYVCKFTEDGAFLWAKTWGGAGYDDSPRISCDRNGRLTIWGMYGGEDDFDPGPGVDIHTFAGGWIDAFVCRYDSDGNFLWAKTWGGAGDDCTANLVYDDDGNMYVSGYFAATVDFDPGPGTDIHVATGDADCFLAKYDAAGNFLWAKTWGGSGGDQVTGMTLQGRNTLLLCGRYSATVDFDPGAGVASQTSGGVYDSYLAEFDAAGTFRWVQCWGGGGDDGAFCLALDAAGTLWVGGTFTGAVDFNPGSGADYRTGNGNTDACISVFTPVNAPPSFTKGADQSVPQNAGPQAVSGWATAISPGPPEEADQLVDFLVAADHPEYFTAPPAISPAGALGYTPNPAACGTATVTVRLHDDGGGTDTSAPQTFTITLAPVLTGVTLAADPGNSGMTGAAQAFIATASGIAPEYAFTVKLKDVKPDRSYSWVTIRGDAAYGASPTCTFTAADPGAYTVAVSCRESGTAAPVYTDAVTVEIGTDTLTGVALAANMTSGVALSDIPPAGIRLTATPAGTGVGATYFFLATLRDLDAAGAAANVPVTLSGDYGGVTFQWHPTEPGYYTLRVIARDATCNVSYTGYLTFLVRAGALKGLVFAASPGSGTALNMLPGGGITLTGTPQGTGTGVEYFFSGLRKALENGTPVNEPITLSTAWSTSRTCAWRPMEPGVYQLTLTARDASYNTSIAKTMNYVLHLAKLTGIASLAADPPSGVAEAAVPAGGITLTATATPANAGVEYFYAAKRRVYQPDGSYADTPVTLSAAWQAGPVYSWHPALPGMYLVTATARDTIYAIISRATISYLIKPASLTGIADFTAAPASGTADNAIPAGGITLTATPQGSGTGARYFFSAKLKDIAADGSSVMVPQTLSTAWSASPTFAWHPAAPGVYTLTVTAKDADGVVSYSKNLSYTLKSATVTGVTAFTPGTPTGTALASLPPGGVVFTTAIAGTKAGVLYRYQVSKFNGAGYDLEPLTDYTASNTFAFHPATAGTYRIRVNACDSTYNTSYYKYTGFVVN